MLKKDKVNFIVTKLDEIYPEVSPPLNHHNNYTLLKKWNLTFSDGMIKTYENLILT